MRKTGLPGRGLALLLLLAFLTPALAGDAPWREAVEEADRALLDRLLSADDAEREAAAAAWDEARLAVLPKYGPQRWPPPPVDALSDEVDPLDKWAVRKKRMMTALVVALQQGKVAQRVAAARSLRDLSPAYTSVIDALAEAFVDESPAVRRAVLETLYGITHLSGGRYVHTKLGEIASRVEDEDAAVRVAALRAVGTMIRYGDANDALRRRALALALKASEDEDASVRAGALLAAEGLAAPKDEALLDALRRGLGDAAPEVRRVAAVGLSSRPDGAQSALPRLRALLEDEDFGVRYASAHAVWSVTRDATGLMPVMIEALDRCEGLELVSVARLLTVIGPPAEAATPGLLHALGRVQPQRHLATGGEVHEALVSIGPSAEVALPAIEEELHRRSAADRRVVLDAVVTVYGEPDRLAAFVVRMLSLYACPDPATVEVTVLHGLGIETPGLLDLVKKRLESEDRWERQNACRHLGRMRSPEAVKLLVEKMQDPVTRPSAIIALMDVGERAAPAVPALVRALSTDPRLAATALARTGGDEDPAVVKALLVVLENMTQDDEGTGVALCDAICRFGGEPEPCLDRLIAALDHENTRIRRDAAEALGRWGPKAEKALPHLRKLMQEGDLFYEGVAAAGAVWQISGEAKPTFEKAVQAAKNSHPTVWEAVHVLRLLGPEAAEAVPLLVDTALAWRRAFWRQEDVMKEAIRALGAIGPAAREALPVLRELEHNHRVREEARTAIANIETLGVR